VIWDFDPNVDLSVHLICVRACARASVCVCVCVWQTDREKVSEWVSEYGLFTYFDFQFSPQTKITRI
jgi:hypothetical protein